MYATVRKDGFYALDKSLVVEYNCYIKFVRCIMWNWLLLVGSDGKPDTYTKITNINFPSVFLGIIIGMLISAFIAFIFKLKKKR